MALIVVQRGLVKPDVLDRHVEAYAARGAGRGSASLLSHLVDKGVVSPGDVPSIKQARAATGCVCAACGEVTFLLPGQTHEALPCERCKKAALGLPGAQPARRSAVQPALPPAPSAAPAARPPAPTAPRGGAGVAAIGTPVEPVPPRTPDAAPPADRRHVQVLAGIGAVALLCFVAPCLWFALAPPPDFAEYLAEPRSGRFLASLVAVGRYDEAGLLVQLLQADASGPPPRRFLGPDDRDDTGAVLPYRLLLERGAALEQRLTQLARDRQSLGRDASLREDELVRLIASEGGAQLHPWLAGMHVDPVVVRGPPPTPRRVIVRLLVRRRPGLLESEQPLPLITEFQPVE